MTGVAPFPALSWPLHETKLCEIQLSKNKNLYFSECQLCEAVILQNDKSSHLAKTWKNFIEGKLRVSLDLNVLNIRTMLPYKS